MSCRLKLSVVQLVLCTLIAIFVEKMKLVGFRHAKTDQQCPVPPKRTFGDVYMTIYMIHFRMLVWCSSSTDHVHLHCNIKVKHKGITTNFINNTGVRNCLSSPWERGGRITYHFQSYSDRWHDKFSERIMGTDKNACERHPLCQLGFFFPSKFQTITPTNLIWESSSPPPPPPPPSLPPGSSF